MVNQVANRADGTPGFTLLELLVVLAIMALLITLVPPVLSKAVPGVRAKAAARDLADTLRDARAAAVTHGRAVDVHFDAEEAQYAVAGSSARALPQGLNLALPAAGNIPLSGTATPNYTLRFYPDGSSSGLHALLGSPGRYYRVDVGWLTGRVSLAEHADNGR